MATVDATEADRDENAGKKASLALQRALNGVDGHERARPAQVRPPAASG